MTEMIHLFRQMVRLDASDLHLNVTSPPQIRVRGELQSLPGEEPLTKYTVRELLYSILTKEQAERLETKWEVDFSYAIPGLARWRVNAYVQRGSLGAAFRIIPEKIRPLSSLGLPDSLYQLCDLPRGIVLVTGPTGSGKSTTLASMIDVINQTRNEHILTVEDPIEFIHTNKNCMVNQREVGSDTEGFAAALKSALRQDPDVILVGEMRDLETIHIALTAAETGHLVFGTLHTSSAAKTIDRVVDVFPQHQQAQIRVQLASSLMGVVAQALVPTADGVGRCVASEVMIPNPAIRNLIREGKVFQIPSIMQTSKGEGMQTLDSALARLVRDGTITIEEALKRCSEPDDFGRLVQSGAGDNVDTGFEFHPPEKLRLSGAEIEAALAAAEGQDAAAGKYEPEQAETEPEEPAAQSMMPVNSMMPADLSPIAPDQPAAFEPEPEMKPAASMMPEEPAAFMPQEPVVSSMMPQEPVLPAASSMMPQQPVGAPPAGAPHGAPPARPAAAPPAGAPAAMQRPAGTPPAPPAGAPAAAARPPVGAPAQVGAPTGAPAPMQRPAGAPGAGAPPAGAPMIPQAAPPPAGVRPVEPIQPGNAA
jgi:twitching motility protein PilT